MPVVMKCFGIAVGMIIIAAGVFGAVLVKAVMEEIDPPPTVVRRVRA